MKKIFALAVAGLLVTGAATHAQNASSLADQAAVMEQAQKAIGKLQDLSETVELQQKRINQLEADLRALREEQSKNAGKPDGASREELRDLAGKVKEIDDKRAADKELIIKEITKLANTPVVATVPTNVKPKRPKTPESGDAGTTTTPLPPSGNYEGFEHTVKSGETLSAIVAAYNKEQGLHNTVNSVLKHPLNAKVKAERMLVGQKVFIPAPAK